MQERREKAFQPPESWEYPLMIDASATTTAATIKRTSNADIRFIAKKSRIRLIICEDLRATFESILNPIN